MRKYDRNSTKGREYPMSQLDQLLDPRIGHEPGHLQAKQPNAKISVGVIPY